MSVLEAIVLGLVQGLTEFLPVSSSGHLVLSQALLGIPTPGITFVVVVHVATSCAVLWAYRGRILRLVRSMVGGEPGAWGYAGLLLLASIPAGLAGTLATGTFERAFARPAAAAALLLVTGGLVWSVRYTAGRATDLRPGPGRALWIGIWQAVSILPGLSRSGATVAAGIWGGVGAAQMAEFSFLLSVPAVLGASLLEARAIGVVATAHPVALAAGFFAALISGIAAIRLFVGTLERGVFHRFAWYCWAVGGGYLIAALLVPVLR